MVDKQLFETLDGVAIGPLVLIALAVVLAAVGFYLLTRGPTQHDGHAPADRVSHQPTSGAAAASSLAAPVSSMPREPTVTPAQRSPSPAVGAAGAARSVGLFVLRCLGALLFVGWLALGALDSCVVVDRSGDAPSTPVADSDTDCGPNEWCGYDLDCSHVGGPVAIYGSDPHGLDGDGDGIGCE